MPLHVCHQFGFRIVHIEHDITWSIFYGVVPEEKSFSAVWRYSTALKQSLLYFTVVILQLIILPSHKYIHYFITMHPANNRQLSTAL